MEARKTLLLEIKRKAGLATPAELATLESTPVVTGDGLVTPRRAQDADAWHRRYAGERVATFYDHAPPHEPDYADAGPAGPPEPTVTNDGLIRCDPAAEPKPTGRENFPWARRTARG